MSTNYLQPMSPEMPREHMARFVTVKYARYGLQKTLLSNPEFVQRLAGAQIVKQEMKVPTVIDYTVQAQPAVSLESVSNDVSLEGYEQHKRLLQAEQMLRSAFAEDDRSQYGLSP